jgi:excisionase family DNA binding protein
VSPLNEVVQKRLYNVKEAGRYLGRSPWAIRHLIWSGELPQVRQGRRVFVDIMDLEQFVERCKVKEPDMLTGAIAGEK